MSVARPRPAAGTENPRLDPACVLVGIPALNEAENIEACLRSIAHPTIRGARIVVADGGSRDRTRDIVRRLQREIPGLVLIDNPARLQAAALNRVAETCAGPEHRVLVRCDAHAVYPPGYVASVAESLLSRQAASVATMMDATGSGCFARAAAWIVDTPLGSGGSAHRGGRRSGYVDHGHHAGFDLDWFRRLGGYDPTFSHNEDAEYDHRLHLAGGRVWLDADIRLAYRMRPTPSSLARQYWRYGRGRARTVRKHRMRLRFRQMLPVLNVVGLLLCLVLAPLAPVFLLGPAAYLLLLAAVCTWMAVLHRSLCGLCSGPALGAMHLAWGAGFLWQMLRPGRDR
jgi:succinoglycan biosynthesis protein ExoA